METRHSCLRTRSERRGSTVRRRLSMSADEKENAPPAKRAKSLLHKQKRERKGAAGPKRAVRVVTKRRASVLEFIKAPGEQTKGGPRPISFQLLVEMGAVVAAAKEQLDLVREQLVELKAEVAALKDSVQKLQEVKQEEREVSVHVRAALEARGGTGTATLKRPPSLSPTPSPAPAPVSPDVPGRSWVPRQHSDVDLPQLSPEDHDTLCRMSRGRVDRYGCLLFRAAVTPECYDAWCLYTNWDGSRGKWELPRNLKEFVFTALRERFPDATPGEERRLVRRINKVLNSPRLYNHL